MFLINVQFLAKSLFKTRSPRVRALGLLSLVFSHGFSKRIEHIEDNM